MSVSQQCRRKGRTCDLKIWIFILLRYRKFHILVLRVYDRKLLNMNRDSYALRKQDISKFLRPLRPRHTHKQTAMFRQKSLQTHIPQSCPIMHEGWLPSRAVPRGPPPEPPRLSKYCFIIGKNKVSGRGIANRCSIIAFANNYPTTNPQRRK